MHRAVISRSEYFWGDAPLLLYMHIMQVVLVTVTAVHMHYLQILERDLEELQIS